MDQIEKRLLRAYFPRSCPLLFQMKADAVALRRGTVHESRPEALMDIPYSFHLIAVWIHLVAAATWIGSMVFFATVVVPVIRRPAHRASAPGLLEEMGARYRILGWASLAVLALTGMLNLSFLGIGMETIRSPKFWGMPFGEALGHKLGLVLMVLITMQLHDRIAGQKAGKNAEETRKAASFIGRVTMALSLAIVYYAVKLARGG